MLVEKISAIWDAVSERLRSPLFSSFSLAWLVINYKLVVVLANEEHYKVKFAYIEMLYNAETNPVRRLLLWPAIACFVYVVLLPALTIAAVWISTHYEVWQNKVRVKIQKTSVLTTAQRDEFDRQTAEIVKQAERTAHEAQTDQLETGRRMSEAVREHFNWLADRHFLTLQSAAPDWPTDSVKMLAGQSLGSDAAREDFASQFGVPKSWAAVLGQMPTEDSFDVQGTAQKMNISTAEAKEILWGMVALHLLSADLVLDTIRFRLRGSSWGALLNNRPA